MEGVHNVKESRSRWINPDAWLRIYRFVDVFEAVCFYLGLLIVALTAIFGKVNLVSLALIWGSILALPIAWKTVLVYKISQVLDVDEDPERFANTVNVALEQVSWFQRGWLNMEHARSKIAIGDIDGALEILNSEELKHGMSQFYVARRIELLGICAILRGESIEEYETELETLAHTPRKYGCSDNNSSNIIRIKRNFDFLKGE